MRFQIYERDIIAKSKLSFVPGMSWEDVAQELRLHLWLKRDRYVAERASERTFAMRLLENKIKDLKKSAYRIKRTIDSKHLTFSQLERTEEGLGQLELAFPIS